MTVNTAQAYHTNQVHYVMVDFTFSAANTTVSLGWVPKGATVIDGGVAITTVFNSATSDTIDIGFRNAGDGTADDPNGYATLMVLTTAGVIPADEMATTANSLHPSGAEITMTYTSVGTVATTGKARAYVRYLVDNDDS